MTTLMEQEARETPDCIEKQWQHNLPVIRKICEQVKQKQPRCAMTIARGSSDHAATFAKYLLETQCGLVTATAAPSTVTLYQSQLHLKNSLVIGISQSGKSPDICEVMQQAKDHGAITIAIVNVEESPLANIADFVLPLHVGAENAVAATKSYIGSLAALIQLTAHLAENKSLIQAMPQLPDTLHAAAAQDWSAMINHLEQAEDSLVLARGYGFPIAQEAALKLKETMGMHAEAFSGAEVLHGPVAVVKPNFPALLFTQNDVTLKGMLSLGETIKKIGGKTLVAVPNEATTTDQLNAASTAILPLPASIHPICDPLMCIQAFYPATAQLAVKRGKNPDAPDNLKKVTETR